jgi:IclR helix-turn-helix domain
VTPKRRSALEKRIAILAVLAEAREPLSRKEIQEKTGIDTPTIGNLVGYIDRYVNERPVHAENLLNRGYVTLEVPKSGRKLALYSITDAGRRELEAAKKRQA